MGQRNSTAEKSSNKPTQKVGDSEIMFQRVAPVRTGESKLQTSAASVSSDKVETDMTSDAETQSIDLELVPSWVNAEQFIDILHDNVENFEKVTKFKACPAMGPGENYMTLILRISIDVLLKDNSNKSVSLMMKIVGEKMKQATTGMNIFVKESAMYFDVIPKLELLYREIGLNVYFAPKAYKLKKDPGYDNILLDDLGPRGFKNANRLDGLNMEHAQAVLRKMAQFHAASAHWIANDGVFSESIMNNSHRESNRGFYDALVSSSKNGFLNSMQHFKDVEKYREAAENAFTSIESDGYTRLKKIEPNEFCVINHGDCWTNNILFRYDADGNILDTYFVDFQLSTWGSPSRDLYYFIISSVNNELKLKHFDYFVRFYHDHLVENLKALSYSKNIPTLREFHTIMIKKGTWAWSTAVMMLPVVLLDPTETAHLENISASSEEGKNLRNLMYTNQRYCKYMEELLPWMYYRGVMDPM